MARPLRIEFDGAVYHVTSRGNVRDNIFFNDEDREMLLDVLVFVVDRFRWKCHAYCLMSNHYHLMIETPHANLSRGMRQLNGVYTQRFNRSHGHVGHLFQGRSPAWLETQWLLSQFSSAKKQAERAYINFVERDDLASP